MPQAAKPATTPSLPGSLATRTDGGPASKQAQRYISGMPEYGDGQELATLQAQAPLAATPTPGSGPAPSGGQPGGQNRGLPPQLVPLTAPSQRPDEPVTTGSPLGPGAGPEVLGAFPQNQGGSTAKQAVQSLASSPDASPELRRLAQILGR